MNVHAEKAFFFPFPSLCIHSCFTLFLSAESTHNDNNVTYSRRHTTKIALSLSFSWLYFTVFSYAQKIDSGEYKKYIFVFILFSFLSNASREWFEAVATSFYFIIRMCTDPFSWERIYEVWRLINFLLIYFNFGFFAKFYSG